MYTHVYVFVCVCGHIQTHIERDRDRVRYWNMCRCVKIKQNIFYSFNFILPCFHYSIGKVVCQVSLGTNKFVFATSGRWVWGCVTRQCMVQDWCISILFTLHWGVCNINLCWSDAFLVEQSHYNINNSNYRRAWLHGRGCLEKWIVMSQDKVLEFIVRCVRIHIGLHFAILLVLHLCTCWRFGAIITPQSRVVAYYQLTCILCFWFLVLCLLYFDFVFVVEFELQQIGTLIWLGCVARIGPSLQQNNSPHCLECRH
jgi:hypothetical protein